MIINRSFKDFKFRHRSKKNQIIFTKKKVKNDEDVLNLIDNFLEEKNSFIFESVEKGKIKGRYTIFGKNPDKIWEFNNNNSYLIQKNKKKKLNDKPEKLIEKIIEDFKFETPKNLPNICSLISGYFSYDSIRYIEKIPDNCKNDLNLPDVRLLRPKTLVIHDNLKKEIFYISNIFKDEKITSYKNKYEEVKTDLFKLLIQSSIKNIHGIEKITNQKIKWYNEDCTDKKAIEKILKIEDDILAIIHFAAFKSVEESVNFPEKYIKNNVGSLKTIIEIFLMKKS